MTVWRETEARELELGLQSIHIFTFSHVAIHPLLSLTHAPHLCSLVVVVSPSSTPYRSPSSRPNLPKFTANSYSNTPNNMASSSAIVQQAQPDPDECESYFSYVLGTLSDSWYSAMANRSLILLRGEYASLLSHFMTTDVHNL